MPESKSGKKLSSKAPVLSISSQPVDTFFKDEGGKSNFLTAVVNLPASVLRTTGPLQLKCALHYESGKLVEERDQNILNLMCNEYEPLVLSATAPSLNVEFRLEKVSRRKDNQRFKVRIDVDYASMGQPKPKNSVQGVFTAAVTVLSKRKTGERVVTRRVRPQGGCCDPKMLSSIETACTETQLSLASLSSSVDELHRAMHETQSVVRAQARTISKLEEMLERALSPAVFIKRPRFGDVGSDTSGASTVLDTGSPVSTPEGVAAAAAATAIGDATRATDRTAMPPPPPGSLGTLLLGDMPGPLTVVRGASLETLQRPDMQGPLTVIRGTSFERVAREDAMFLSALFGEGDSVPGAGAGAGAGAATAAGAGVGAGEAGAGALDTSDLPRPVAKRTRSSDIQFNFGDPSKPSPAPALDETPASSAAKRSRKATA